MKNRLSALARAAAACVGAPAAARQGDAPKTCAVQGFMAPPAAYKSVEVLPDGRATFRICAPQAQVVKVTSADIADVIPMGFPAGTPFGLDMMKDEMGLWSVTTGKPVPADNYRFAFNVDKYDIKHVFHESEDGHTWINWRRYLEDFAPRLFQ